MIDTRARLYVFCLTMDCYIQVVGEKGERENSLSEQICYSSNRVWYSYFVSMKV